VLSRVLPPPNISGPVELSVRHYGPCRGGVSLSLLDLVVSVFPVSDALSVTLDSVGIECKDPIRVGATLADDTTGLRQQDNTTGIGNKNRPETISQIVVVILVLTNEVIGTVVPVVDGRLNEGSASAEVIFNGTSRTFTITSTIIKEAPGGDLTQLTQELLDLVEEDIRVTLGSFSATNGPEKTDENGFIDVTATTRDVGSGLFSTSETSFMLPS
jgi:hypothetical protein